MTEGLPIMRGKRTRRETMDKSQIPLARLAEQYFITCHNEGKTASTLRGYREKLGRFMHWCDGACLGDISAVLVREYISYLQTAPKYEGHTFHESNGEHVSAAKVQNHVRVLRAFSSSLQREAISNFRGEGLYPVTQAIETAKMLPALVQLR